MEQLFCSINRHGPEGCNVKYYLRTHYFIPVVELLQLSRHPRILNTVRQHAVHL